MSGQSAISALALALAAGCAGPRPIEDGSPPQWEKLETEPAKDKQDDASFIDSERGWYVNSLGKIFKTVDGGRAWIQVAHRPGTYWRSILFLDERRGFAGNLGQGAIEGFSTVMALEDFENLNSEIHITDPTLIYETSDGGRTWTPAKDLPKGARRHLLDELPGGPRGPDHGLGGGSRHGASGDFSLD